VGKARHLVQVRLVDVTHSGCGRLQSGLGAGKLIFYFLLPLVDLNLLRRDLRGDELGGVALALCLGLVDDHLL
jgi:hypothetical protein